MYGPGYGAESDPYDVESPRDHAEVIAELNRRRPGRLLDFGCGDGELMELVQKETGWSAVGVEFDPKVAARTAERTGSKVLTYTQVLEVGEGSFDALHAGDVIEHLTALPIQMRALLGRLRPGALILAEGPLEGGPSLFEVTVQASQALRNHTPVYQPPYHVIQATASGQRRFFALHGLEERSWRVYEVDWPAPSKLHRVDLAHPRVLALRALRVASRSVAKLSGWGNRYRYVGVLPQ